jgi:hypothetical protein
MTVNGNVLTMNGSGQGGWQLIMSGGNAITRQDGVWYFQNAAGSANKATLDNSGNLTVTGWFSAGTLAGSANAGDVSVSRSATTGYIWYGSNSQHYIGFDGSVYQFYNAPGHFSSLNVDGNINFPGGGGGNGPFLYWAGGYWWGQYSNAMITNCGIIYLSNNTGIYWSWDGTYMRLSQNLIGSGNIACQGVGPGYGFTAPNSAAAYGQGYANAWINASSADFKKNVAPIANPLGILLNPALRGVEYDHTWERLDLGVRDGIFTTTHHIGFVADDWLPHVPEIVAVDENGKAEGMDYARVTALLWEALREYITSTNARLTTLEQHH